MKFSDVDIDLDEFTVKELKKFIRAGIDYINEMYKYNESREIKFKKPQQNFFDEIESMTTRGRFGNKLGYGLNMRKADLLDKAENIRRFMRLSRDYDEEKINKAYEKYKHTVGDDITEEEYAKIVNIYGGLGADVTEKFGSTNVVSLIKTYTNVESYKLVSIIYKAVRNPSNITQYDFLSDVKEKVKAYVNEMNKKK